MSYEINWEKQGVVVKFREIFDSKANFDATLEIYESPKFENLKYVIWDLSEISELKMTKEEVTLAAMHDHVASSRLPDLKMAFIANDVKTRQICDHYTTTYQSRLTGWNFMVSDNMKEIKSWLGL